MHRKLYLTVYFGLISLLLASCGGGGSGADVDVPSGQNPGISSVVQLGGSQRVAQTGASITLMATVLDGTGRAVQGVNVTFTNLSSIGTLNGASTTTGSDGIARATLSSTTLGFITVRASTASGNGQIWDDETFYFSSGEPIIPVSEPSISVIAVPSTIAPGESSTVTASVLTGAGAEVPDGTIVNFSTNFGSITSFATTSDGVAEATYTAPSTSGTATITASYSGVSDTTTVTVTGSLTVLPSEQTLTNPSVGNSTTYKISGGQSPYSVYSSHPDLVSVSVSGSTVTATVIALPAADTTVTITIVDSAGNSTEATLTIDIP